MLGEYISNEDTSLLLHMNNNLTDSSSHEHSATNYGVTFVDGKIGTHSGNFDADYFSLAHSTAFDITDDWTISFWFKMDDISPANHPYVIGEYDGGGWNDL